jgi:hypothetical protein
MEQQANIVADWYAAGNLVNADGSPFISPGPSPNALTENAQYIRERILLGRA